jgi:hypothetical protein
METEPRNNGKRPMAVLPTEKMQNLFLFYGSFQKNLADFLVSGPPFGFALRSEFPFPAKGGIRRKCKVEDSK